VEDKKIARKDGYLECGNEDIGTSLRFTQERMKQMWRELPRLKGYVRGPISYPDDEEVQGTYYEFSKKLNSELNRIFGEWLPELPGDKLGFALRWERGLYNKRYWYFGREAERDLCGEHYRDVVEGRKGYESCKCPKKFVEICKSINETIKKYSLSDKYG